MEMFFFMSEKPRYEELEQRIQELEGEIAQLRLLHEDQERKGSDSAMQKRIDEQRLLLDTIDTQIWYLTDVETYGRVNRAHVDFLGLSFQDVAHKKLTDFLSPEVADVCIKGNVEVFDTGKPFHTEEWIHNSLGEKRLIAIAKTPRLNENGRVEFVVCAGTDITELRASEKQLRASEAKYRRLIKNMPAVVFQFRMDSDGIFTLPYVSESIQGMMGVSAEAVMEDSSLVLGMIHPDDQAWFRTSVLKSAKALQPYEERFRYIKDGEELWLEARAMPEASVDGSILWDGFMVDVTRIKLLEMEVQDRQENLHSFFNTMTDMVFVARPDGTLIHTNASVSRLLGYTPDELASMHILDCHRPGDRCEAKRIMNEMFRGQREICPLPLAAKDGKTIPVETRVWFGKWGGDPCLFGISKNLSAEQEAHQRFERLFRSNPAPMAVTSLPERRFGDVNESFLKTLGYEKSEIIGRTSAELCLFSDQEQQNAVAKAFEEKGRVVGMELQVRCKDGSLRNGLFSGEMIQNQGRDYFLTVMVDITEREAALQDLRRRITLERLIGKTAADLAGASGENVDAAIDRAMQSLGLFMDADRVYIFQIKEENDRVSNTHEWCNEGIEPQIARLKNISLKTELPYFAERILKREAFHVPDVELLPDEARLEQAHFQAQGIQSMMVFPIEASGNLLGFFGFDFVGRPRVWVEDDQSLLRFMGNTIGYVIQRIQSEARRAVLEHRLHQVEKTESLSRMAGAVAHHFNNMLTGVLGNLELARMDVPQENPIGKTLERAHHSGLRAAELSRLMLTLLGQTVSNPIPMDLAETCLSHLAGLKAVIPGCVGMTTDISAPGPVIKADPVQVGQILDSLLTNGWEAIGDREGKTQVSVSTAKMEEIAETHRFPLNWQASTATYACLSVTDNGTGMEGGTIDRIFDPFYTDKFTGRGLGLPVALGIVKSFGGCITVKSEPGRGSVLRVYFPLFFEQTP